MFRNALCGLAVLACVSVPANALTIVKEGTGEVGFIPYMAGSDGFVTINLYVEGQNQSCLNRGTDDCFFYTIGTIYTPSNAMQQDQPHYHNAPRCLTVLCTYDNELQIEAKAGEYVSASFGWCCLPISYYRLTLTGPPALLQQDETPTPAVVPLPTSLPLLASTLGALGLFGWRRNVLERPHQR